ncbi:glycosyltransferase [Dokdonia sp. Asnod1-B02]|uniref:glycosyltransferase n=1 Tax=Dokdonia sp. Asnod1-B02 TaxID=3160573 RepID=UPI00386B22E0
MKILFVSMNSIHFRRWSDQLRDSGHEVYWFDVKDQGYAPSMSWMTQITGWKKGFLKKRGRTFIKNKFPQFYKTLVRRFDHPIQDAFAKALIEIEPDVVHSFALYTSCLPILSIMNQFNKLPWIYSSWGSDLFNKKNKPDYLDEVPLVLKRVDYLITDCHRDFIIAKENGFKGRFLGVYPGGGGFNKRLFNQERNKNSFIVKGYHNDIGKAIPVLEALIDLSKSQPLEIIIFGASIEVLEYLKLQKDTSTSLRCYENISRDKLFKLLDNSRFYIGNSLSDGMPNTLFESIFCGCIPIQSNPGNVTEELITHGVNGFLIEHPLNVCHIKNVINEALNDNKSIGNFYDNNADLRDFYERSNIQQKVIDMYNTLLV